MPGVPDDETVAINKQLIGLVKGYPSLYNPKKRKSRSDTEKIWAKIGRELQESREYNIINRINVVLLCVTFPHPLQLNSA